ncbi:MAG: aminotransferase class I/II-fold pyridoxal phosphate-dependent enzyme [Spirochaetaceae bacterium]|jgi:aspartate/methionine/tyrosine aminotransferase|nr:aminotransferase class I/II-fold pyridoxal phosphate-dependent enzyme [Spirochaetaceae bacterium]
MNRIAQELNDTLKEKSKVFYEMLSDFGRNIYMPKGILSQGDEAKKKAFKYNATLGVAIEGGSPMYLSSVFDHFDNMDPFETFTYAPPMGLPGLRSKWKDKMIEENPSIGGLENISLPVVTSGLTHGISIAADLFAEEGDEIIIPEQMWGNYRLIYEVKHKAKIINYPLFDDSLSGLNINGLEDAIAQTKKDKITLLFNFPNNPTGYTPSLEEEKKLVDLIEKYAERGKKILVISDDSYYGLLFKEGHSTETIFSKCIGLHKNICTIKLDGFTKEFYAWGFRVGFITFGDFGGNSESFRALERKVSGTIRSTLSSCSKPAQSILEKVLTEGRYKQEKADKFIIMKERAEKVRQVVYDDKYKDCWEVYPFNSGYFMCIRLKGVNSNELRLFALDKYGIGTISLGEKNLRIAYSSIEKEDISDIFETLSKAIREYKSTTIHK